MTVETETTELETPDLDLSQVPDVVPVEDVKGLKSALSKIKEQSAADKARADQVTARLKELEKTLEKINPDEYTRLKAEEQETIKLREEMAKQRLTIENEFKTQYETLLEKERTARTESDQKYLAITKKENLYKPFAEAGGLAKYFPDFQRLVESYVVFGDDGSIQRVVDKNGTPQYVTDERDKKAREMTPTEFAMECRQGKHGPILKECFELYNKASGSGFNSGTKSGDGFVYLPKSEMSDFMAGGGDPEKAKENTKLVRAGKVRWT
jgi:hypothetical protein